MKKTTIEEVASAALTLLVELDIIDYKEFAAAAGCDEMFNILEKKYNEIMINKTTYQKHTDILQ